MKDILIKKIGEELEPGQFETLKDMQAIVEGHIELVSLAHEIDMWVNEEGLLEELPLNVVMIKDGQVIQYIVGNVFFASHDSHGESISLNSFQKKWIEDNLKIVGVCEGKLLYGFRW